MFHILLTSNHLTPNCTHPAQTYYLIELTPLLVLKTDPSLFSITFRTNFMPIIYGKHHCLAVHYY